MGKQINLGKKLKYPITITKLLKQPGQSFQKQDSIFQYTFTWFKEVGDHFRDETWQEKQTTIADWDSPADGTLLQWRIEEGMIIDRDTACMEIEESCPHPIQFAGLCAICGKDMKETSWVTEETDSERAPINMFHNQNLVSVSRDEASRAEEQLQRRLLKHRKLSLVVDLDQTIIHACIDPTVGEWQHDPNSPNHEAVKDVKAFQLSDDGPRGLTSGCWYYIKMRPGLKDFLEHVAELYELHVYTMGTRAYAQNVAQIVDPERKLFGDRIISRDENGNLIAKTLSRLFPVDTKMVVIIDDRADVWPKNRPNLIKVFPYSFFVGIGDINSSFLPKRQDSPKTTPAAKLQVLEEATKEATEGDDTGSMSAPDEQSTPDDETGVSGNPEKDGATAHDQSRISALEELVSMGGGDDPTIRRIQAQEQEEFLEKQIKERPLLHMQQELEKEEVESSTTSTNGEDESDQPQQQHRLLRDDDRELIHVEDYLKRLHLTFYDDYDRSLAMAVGGRVAHLRPGMKKKVALKDDIPDLKTVPDIGEVMARLKANTLTNTVIVLSGLVSLVADFWSSDIVQQAKTFGAQVETRISRRVTHVVVSPDRTRTHKARQAAKYPHIKVVTRQWLTESVIKWKKEDEAPYIVETHRDDKVAGSSARSLNSSDDGVMEENGTEDDDYENRSNTEDQDLDSVMPGDLDDATSPIDDLQKFDWGSADAELEAFMASGSDDGDSDTGSIASHESDRSQRSNLSVRSKKHPREETDDEDSDEQSKLAKKQRLARGRTTGLKTVKTPHSVTTDSSLPTPEITGEEELDDNAAILPNAEEDDGDFNDNDLEAQMLAEFEKGDWEEQQGGVGTSDDDDGGG